MIIDGGNSGKGEAMRGSAGALQIVGGSVELDMAEVRDYYLLLSAYTYHCDKKQQGSSLPTTKN